MNKLMTFVYTLAVSVAEAFLWVDGRVRRDAKAVAESLRDYAFVCASLIFVGAVIGHIEYRVYYPGDPSAKYDGEVISHYIFAVNFAASAILLGISLIRAVPIMVGARVGVGVLKTLAISASPSGRFLSAASAADEVYVTLSKAWWGAILSLHFFCWVLTVVPLYRNIPAFLVFFGVAIGVGYIAGAMEPKGPWYEYYLTMMLGVYILTMIVIVINALLPGELYSRTASTWSAFTATENAARSNNWIAILWFIAIVGVLFSGTMMAIRISQGKRSRPYKTFFASLGLLLFMIFLGPRMIAAAEGGVDTAARKFDAWSQGSRNSNPDQKKVYPRTRGSEVRGPYWINQCDCFELGKAYKFADEYATYEFRADGKLHKFATPEAFYRHYQCPTDITPLECRGIYEMPSRISKEDKILEGSIIN